jgi:hypothetical protein
MSVMTQHDESMDDGVQLVQRLAHAAAAVLVAERADLTVSAMRVVR